MTQPPAWLSAAVDQLLARMQSEVPPAAFAGYNVVMTPLTEPPEGASDAVIERYERTCDNCGAYCPDTVPFYTGAVRRTLGSTPVEVTFGACERCAHA